MTETKLTFMRHESKYLVPAEKFDAFWTELEPCVEPDTFFESKVCSLYYDSDSYELIRASLDKPVYKEKLRLRSYGVPERDGTIFVELKKKYKGIVYKRRVQLSELSAMDWIAGGEMPGDGQIIRETDWVIRHRKLYPKVYIACDRLAYRGREDSELRITFDRSIRWRDTDLMLSAGDFGEELLRDGQRLMEIKMPGSAPLWLSRLLSKHGIFPTSFSKYGTCYSENMAGKIFVTE